jgi:hypothetical protein
VQLAASEVSRALSAFLDSCHAPKFSKARADAVQRVPHTFKQLPGKWPMFWEPFCSLNGLAASESSHLARF